MKTVKLIAGQENCLFTRLPAGHAEGSNKPKRQRKPEVKPVVTRLRKQEGLVF